MSMLVFSVDKAFSFIDRHFVIGYWVPSFLLGMLLFFTADWSLPWLGLTASDYFALQGLRLGSVTLGLLFLVTLLAYLLRAFARPIVRLYEGYWPWRWLQEKGIQRQVKRWRHLRDLRMQALEEPNHRRYARLQAILHYTYPPRRDRILPTRLGNVLRAAEDYPKSRYGLDGVFWWPRLEPLLPEKLIKRLEIAFTELIALLNLATMALLFALLLVANSVVVFPEALSQGKYAVLFSWLIVALLLVPVSYFIYRGAVVQAYAFGKLVRVAYDEHRFLILDALFIPRPSSLAEEMDLWNRLFQWLYQLDLEKAREIRYVRRPAGGEKSEETC